MALYYIKKMGQNLFEPSKKGLYYSEVKHDIRKIHVHTVDINKSEYSIIYNSGAKNAHELQDIIGGPSTEDVIKYVSGNMIPDSNITRQDILWAEVIFWHSLGSIKEKNETAYTICKIYLGTSP